MRELSEPIVGRDLRNYLHSQMTNKYARRSRQGLLVHELSQCKKRVDFDSVKEQVAELRRWHPRLMIGELIHQGVFQALTRLYQGSSIVIEGEFVKEVAGYCVVGHPDVVIYEGGSPLKVVDIKYSTRRVDKVDKAYACQVALYRWLTDAKYASILFVTPSDIIEVPVNVHLDVASHIKRWETTFPLWGPEECEWCEYKHICGFSKKREVYVEPLD
ncbi:MAG: hypothetical protein DRJ97_06285 [Thermoprotei archaeon]|nr:MAG: hypothetical protein DRJ97_06285 [Thermoprotei archaeon]